MQNLPAKLDPSPQCKILETSTSYNFSISSLYELYLGILEEVNP